MATSPKIALTHERLKELLHYDPETGHFTWLVDRGGTRKARGEAGTLKPEGYIHIQIDYKMYKAHRLAWFYMTGDWPDDQIDHKDTNSSNNAWNNLREADKYQNSQNRSHHKTSKLGIKGVSKMTGFNRYRAQITYDRKTRHLGYYDTVEEAAEAYAAAAKKYFGEFARLS